MESARRELVLDVLASCEGGLGFSSIMEEIGKRSRVTRSLRPNIVRMLRRLRREGLVRKTGDVFTLNEGYPAGSEEVEGTPETEVSGSTSNTSSKRRRDEGETETENEETQDTADSEDQEIEYPAVPFPLVLESAAGLKCRVCDDWPAACHSLRDCAHWVCGGCLHDWLRTSPCCPVCSKPVGSLPVRAEHMDTIINDLVVPFASSDAKISLTNRRQAFEELAASPDFAWFRNGAPPTADALRDMFGSPTRPTDGDSTERSSQRRRLNPRSLNRMR